MQFVLRGHEMALDPSGALWWADHALLVVADLHLEKGAAFARRGCLLPPYDTHATLERLEALLARYRPRVVVSLGDGFHDRAGPDGLTAELGARLTGLMSRSQWVWITGNHDPVPPTDLGGAALPELALDGLVFRHMPTGRLAGEIAGHFHPKARVATRRLNLSRACFVADEERLLLPAFGSFTGGLNILDPAIMSLFPSGCSAFLLGERQVFRFPSHVLAREPAAPRHRAS